MNYAGHGVTAHFTMATEGSTATIVARGKDYCWGYTKKNPEEWVEKCYKRGSQGTLDHERLMHGNIEYLLEGWALNVPVLNYDPTSYIMERVDVSRPLWEANVSDRHIEILAGGMAHLWRHGYELRDVEVYIQPDDSLCMLDFGQVTKTKKPSVNLQSAAIVPPSEVERLEKAWMVKTLPPTVQKSVCPLGCLCKCCMQCTRQMCHGFCGDVHMQKC